MGGKEGENDQRPASEQTVSPSGSATPNPGDDEGKTGGDTNEHTGKPGENK